MLKDKYGAEFTAIQLKQEAEFLHKEIHRLLYGKENDDPKLQIYYDKLQRMLAGMNELLSQPPELVSLMSDLEAARIEAASTEFSHDAYRRLILDSHSILDRLFGGDDNDHAL